MNGTHPPSDDERDRPRSFAALRHPGARPYIFGGMLIWMGDSTEHVISYWMIFQKFHSPELAGFAVIAHWLPFLLFSVYSGALADRFDPRRIIQIGAGLFILVSLGWGVLFLTDTLEIWHAVALLIVHGLAGVFLGPASQLLIHDIVGSRHLQSAVRLIATGRNLGFLAGPAVGGGRAARPTGPGRPGPVPPLCRRRHCHGGVSGRWRWRRPCADAGGFRRAGRGGRFR